MELVRGKRSTILLAGIITSSIASLVSSSGVSSYLLIRREVLRIVCFFTAGKALAFLTKCRNA